MALDQWRYYNLHRRPMDTRHSYRAGNISTCAAEETSTKTVQGYREGLSQLCRSWTGKVTVSKTLRTGLLRPWILFLHEPIVTLLGIYAAIITEILYLLFAATPIVYVEKRGWTAVVGGLAFVGIAVGLLFSSACSPHNRQQTIRKGDGKPRWFRTAWNTPCCMHGGKLRTPSWDVLVRLDKFSNSAMAGKRRSNYYLWLWDGVGIYKHLKLPCRCIYHLRRVSAGSSFCHPVHIWGCLSTFHDADVR